MKQTVKTINVYSRQRSLIGNEFFKMLESNISLFWSSYNYEEKVTSEKADFNAPGGLKKTLNVRQYNSLDNLIL